MPKSNRKGSCRLFNINVNMTAVLRKITQAIDTVSVVCPNLLLTENYFSVAFSKACNARSNSLQHKPTHVLKDHHMAVSSKRAWIPGKIHHLLSKPISSQLNMTFRLTGFQRSKTQTSAGLLFSLHVSWGCPVLNQTYFANVPWVLISCVHPPHLVVSGRCSLRLCTVISFQGKAVWGNNSH